MNTREKYHARCKACGNVICGGEYCSYCNSKSLIWRDIQKMVRNKIREIERKKGNNPELLGDAK